MLKKQNERRQIIRREKLFNCNNKMINWIFICPMLFIVITWHLTEIADSSGIGSSARIFLRIIKNL
jgi:Mn2+/Fe2+ NRAMP family transporter